MAWQLLRFDVNIFPFIGSARLLLAGASMIVPDFIPLIMLTAVLTIKKLWQFTPSIVALASVLVIIGAWGKRYLIVVPTLSNPYLQNKNLPYDWIHYRPTWVEWSITFGGVAIFLILYMMFTKLFPMVSIWETRHDNAQLGSSAVPVAQPAAQRIGSVPTMTIVLLACTLFGAGQVRADQKPPAKKPAETTLSLEWQQVATPAPKDDEAKRSQPGKDDVGGANGVLGHVFGWLSNSIDDPTRAAPSMVVTAKLLDAQGQPLAYQVVGLSLKTSFGKLDFGSRPTNAEGKAQFSIQDRRFGQYSLEGTYDGGDKFAAAHAAATVDFGPRPEPSLPSEGVLITPYATAWIGMPFLGFFGLIWLVFLYIGVYLLWYRLPQIRRQQAKTR